MRLLVVNVNTTTSMTDQITAQARSVPPPGTQIVGFTPPLALGAVLCLAVARGRPPLLTAERVGRDQAAEPTRAGPDTVGQPTG
jgi:hypothetical protein